MIVLQEPLTRSWEAWDTRWRGDEIVGGRAPLQRHKEESLAHDCNTRTAVCAGTHTHRTWEDI